MFESQPGRLAGRYLRAMAHSKGFEDAYRGFVQSQRGWQDHRRDLEMAGMIKSAVSAVTAGGSGLELVAVGTSFLEALRPVSIVSRFTQARLAPTFVRLVYFATGATAASNLGEGMPIPVSRSSANAALTLRPTKTAAITVVTRDLLRFAGPATEENLTADLAAAVGLAEDLAFISPATSGSILNGATSTVSSGATLSAIDADLKGAIATLVAAKSTLAAALWIMSPTTATNLSLMRGSGGELAYPDVTVRGGTLAGLPVLVSAAVSGYIALVDQAGVVLGQDPRVALDVSEEAAFELADNPIENSMTPTAATTVSMLQTDSVALRSVLFRAWAVPVPGLVTFISGVTY